MADYKIDADNPITKRLRYFDGQFLRDQDFIDEQRYHTDRNRRLARATLSPGVVSGLLLTIAEKENRVRVARGFGVDTEGRFILLVRDVDLKLPSPVAKLDSPIQLPVGPRWVVIGYRDRETDRAPEGGGGTVEETRFDEAAEPVLAPAAPAPTAPDTICLGKVSRTSSGWQVDYDSRQTAGLALPPSSPDPRTPGVSPEPIRLTAIAPTEARLEGQLSITGATSVGNAFRVTGATNLNTGLAVTGATNLVGELGVTGAASLGGSLGVTGRASLDGGLTVTKGSTNLSGALSVTGPTSLLGGLTVTQGPAVTDVAKIPIIDWRNVQISTLGGSGPFSVSGLEGGGPDTDGNTPRKGVKSWMRSVEFGGEVEAAQVMFSTVRVRYVKLRGYLDEFLHHCSVDKIAGTRVTLNVRIALRDSDGDFDDEILVYLRLVVIAKLKSTNGL